MAQPLPIYVALVGSRTEDVRKAKNYFRLSAPGIGAAYLATSEPNPILPVQPIEEIPHELITLWVALDAEALSLCKARHEKDTKGLRYGREFYDHHLPQPCLLVDCKQDSAAFRMQLTQLAREVTEAWYGTS